MGVRIEAMDNTGESPAHRLRRARIAGGGPGAASAAAFARLHNISDSTYRSHETGNRDISPQAARRYAAILNVSPTWLMFGGKRATDSTPSTNGMRRDLPIMGTAAGAVSGAFQLGGDPVDD